MPFTVEAARLGTGIQLAQAKPTNASATSIYSPADGVSAEIIHIIVANTTTSAVTFRMFHDEDGTTYTQDTALFYDVSIAANHTVQYDVKIYMVDPNGNLAFRTATASALTVTLYGTETLVRAR